MGKHAKLLAKVVPPLGEVVRILRTTEGSRRNASELRRPQQGWRPDQSLDSDSPGASFSFPAPGPSLQGGVTPMLRA